MILTVTELIWSQFISDIILLHVVYTLMKSLEFNKSQAVKYYEYIASNINLGRKHYYTGIINLCDMGPPCPTLMTRLLVSTSSVELADRWIITKLFNVVSYFRLDMQSGQWLFKGAQHWFSGHLPGNMAFGKPWQVVGKPLYEWKKNELKKIMIKCYWCLHLEAVSSDIHVVI